MENKIFRFVLLSIAAMLALPFALAKPKYPKTAPCPMDAGTAHATGKTKTTDTPGCIAVEYKHKGTDFPDPFHPQKFAHVFWSTVCDDAGK
jgi:hypothetical protein